MKIILILFILLTVFSLSTFAQDFPYTSLEGHTSRVTKIVFSPDGTTLASVSEDRTIRLWDVATRTHKYTLTGHNSYIYSVAFSPDGLTLASGSENGRIRFWNVITGQYKVTLEGHNSSVRSVAFSPDGNTLASGSSDHTIRLWNATTGLYKVTLEGHSETINSVAFSPDGQTLTSGSSDRTIRLWSATTGFHKQTLTGHTNSIYDISFIEEGQTLASKSNDGTIRLWDTATGQHKEGLSVNLRDVSINSDGTMLAGVYSSRNISLWDIATESEITSLTGHTSDIYAVTFSPSGKTLASGGSDHTVRLWDLSTRVNIMPSTIESPPIGQQFKIDINIVGGQDVRGYEVIVEYDRDSLSYVSHAHGDYFSDKVYRGPIIRKLGSVSFSNVSTAEAGEGDGTLATITFKVISRKASTISLTAILSNSDGERLPYIAISGKVIEPPWDVNGDGSVDILDLSFVAARFGDEGQTEADVNSDGVVDIKDLITVASGMGREAEAPSGHHRSSFKELPSRATVQQWLTEAQQLNLTDSTSQRGILFLEYLLASLTPKETALLANYPNPFNPETWIPYQLAQSADVTISIYTIDGTMIRTLNLGHKPSGVYENKTVAAYWDGRNETGESVASGVYFYTLSTAGKFKSTRKMLILK
ncbi:T9SS type A sorting domain-containing protein [Candidatus Poribacteria bacterium]|nr:T9SS type A sorting domain-containing protein [Candidatus Poribacteria bacterium]